MKSEKIIQPNYRKLILKKAKEYCEVRKIGQGYLGALIVNDGDFFTRLEDGGDCRASTLVKVENWLDKNTLSQ